MPDNFDLQIHRIIRRDEDRSARSGGGGEDVVFEGGASAAKVLTDLDNAEPELVRLTGRFPQVPVVMRVRLKERALAKSHRPTVLFDDEAPIIGVGALGELLVAVTMHSARILHARIQEPTSKRLRANISTIEAIDILSAREKVDELSFEPDADGTFALKVKLFDYHDTGVNDESLRRFLVYANELGIEAPTVYQYSPDLRVFGMQIPTPALAREVADFPTVRTASAFPRLRHGIDFASTIIGALEQDRFPDPVDGEDYPTVGVFDGGTDPQNVRLARWLVDRYEPRTGIGRDFSHGSFVAGLIVSAKALNGMDASFPAVNAKILDIVAMPARGLPLSEPDLIAILDDALNRYPNIRVWNLSIGYPYPCAEDDFSDLARALDARQDRHNALFVIAAGNYTTRPLRAWPSPDLAGQDRVSSPGDSVRAVTVGSVAHRDNGFSAVRAGEPSPFSRRGAGPSHIPKPEVHHNGGNCSSNGDYSQIGVLSLDATGQMAEDVGTSFSTPIVSSLAANVDRALNGTASLNMLKALLIHNGILNAPSSISLTDLNYFGFGKPRDVVDIHACDPWSFTFMFEPQLVSGYYYSIQPFPLPPCLLRNDKLYGEVTITVVYDPPLDANYGIEYCRSNVEVSFGTYLLDADGKRHQKGKVPAEPTDAKKMLEKYLIEHGFKWSPTKVYRKRFSGVRGDTWRLAVELLHRSGFAPSHPQEAVILVTVRDLARKLPVYAETANSLRLSGRPSTLLRVRNQARYRR